MKKFIKLIAIALSLLTVLSLAACSQKSNYSYWEVTRYEDPETKDPLTYYVELSIVRENPIEEIWINISDLKVEKTEIAFFYGTISTSSGKTTVTKDFLKDSDGWVKLTDDKTHSVSSIKLTFVDTMQVNEVFVIDSKDNKTELSLKTYGEKASATSTSRNEYTAEDLKALEAEHTALCIVDEQDSFNLSEVEALYDAADKKHNPQLVPGESK